MKRNEELHYLSNADFKVELAKFRTDFGLSFTDLTEICGNQRFASRTTLSRVANNSIRREMYYKSIPIIEESLEKFLYETRKLGTEEAENILFKLFPGRKEKLEKMLINRCELTAGAVKFFNLNGDPFDVDVVPNEDDFFTNPELDEICSRVKDAVLFQRWVVVTGGVGTGKSSMKIRVHYELQKQQKKVYLLHPEFFDMNKVSVGAIARSILEEFEVKCPQSAPSRVRKIKQLLTSLHRDNARVALVFDECHHLNDNVLTSLKNFWELTNDAYSRLLGIVLFGQPKFVETTLRDVRFREIAERVNHIEMPPLEKSARDYLTHRLNIVGGNIDELFEPEAIEKICRVAKTPLSLGNLANSALMKAYKQEEKQVVESMLSLPSSPQLRGLRRAA